MLGEAQALCATLGLSLPCTLDTIGVAESGAAGYVGDAPSLATGAASASSVEQVALELAGLLRHRSPEERSELCRELLSFQRRDLAPAQGAHLGALLTQLLT
jgi:hypothetical protein